MEAFRLQLRGDWAHFRKPFTTSAPLTYKAPPRTALAGLFGAVLGLGRSGEDNYHDVLAPENVRFGVSVDEHPETRPLNRNRFKIKGDTENMVRLKTAPESITRKQVTHEYVTNPAYTVWVVPENDELAERFRPVLEDERSHFTPYLGTNECLASYRFDGRTELNEQNGGPVDTLVPVEDRNFVLEQGCHYRRENMPTLMETGRKNTRFREFIFDMDGDPIEVEGSLWRDEDVNRCVLPLWSR